MNGFIDWTWSAQEIVRFCYAFDNPFGGASTYLDQERVRLKQVEIDDEVVKFHPFQYGLIYRISNNHVWIAAKDGGLKVGQILKPNLTVIRVGKRFVTDNLILMKAKMNLDCLDLSSFATPDAKITFLSPTLNSKPLNSEEN